MKLEELKYHCPHEKSKGKWRLDLKNNYIISSTYCVVTPRKKHGISECPQHIFLIFLMGFCLSEARWTFTWFMLLFGFFFYLAAWWNITFYSKTVDPHVYSHSTALNPTNHQTPRIQMIQIHFWWGFYGPIIQGWYVKARVLPHSQQI